MGFLAPGAFVAGTALLLAILATYLLRPRRPSRRVSSTLLWLSALHEMHAQRPWQRVPPSLLLLLQIATLGAMMAALARPYLLSTSSSGAFSIVLLDASASMQATDVAPSRFEVARERVLQMIDTLDSGQSLAIVSLDAQPRVIAPPDTDRTELRRELQSLQPTTLSADLAAALSVASALAEGHADAQVTVVADGSLDRSHMPPGFSLPVRYLGVGSDAENLAVAGLGTRDVGGRLSALAHLVNSGSRSQTASLVLRVDGTRFDARSVTIDAGSSADAEWDDLPPGARTLEVRLDQLDSDSLALDNAAWAVLGGDRQTRVLLVSDGNAFVERALALRPGTRVMRVSPETYPALINQPDQAFDLVVLDGVAAQGLRAGSSVLLLHPPAGNGLVNVGPDVPISSVSPGRQDDPVLTDVALDGVHVSRSRQLDSPEWADAVLTSPETPLLLLGDQSGRRVGVLGFDVHASDLPLQAAFPVLVQHVLDWLVPPGSTATPVVQVGESVALAPLPEAVSVEVIAPDGSQTQLAPPLPPPAFTDTNQPGLYQVVQRDTSGRETTSFVGVNFINPRESRLAKGLESGAPSVGPRNEPLKAPQEFWKALAVLALVLLAVELALARWQFSLATGRGRLALMLRLSIASLLMLALLGASLPQAVQREAVVFVADVSSSVQDAQPQVAAFLSQAVAATRPGDAYALVATARDATVSQVLTSAQNGDAIAPPSTSGPTDATDLAAGLRLAGNLLPAGFRPRVVLLSDGQETTGDAVSQARALRMRGVEVDVVPLPTASGPEALVDSVSTPTTVHEGERFSIGVRLVTNVANSGTLRVLVNDRAIAEQSVTLNAGSTDLTFGFQAPQAGLLDVQATFEADHDTLTRNNTARSVVEVQGPPRVLVVEQRPGEGALPASALLSSGMRVDTRAVADMPDRVERLGDYAAVVLADVSAQSLTHTQQTSLQSFVRDLGRGLLAIGGDTSFGQGEYLGTPLDEALPVRSSVRSHHDQGRIALLLVIDRSGSMADDPYHEGTTKLDMAIQAATLSTQQLGPRDLVSILSFDSNQHWIVPMTGMFGVSPTALQDQLATLQADGGTDIFPALSAAFTAIKDTDARYKHVILLTDGESCCGGDYAALQERMRAADVTLSTIAIGSDADQQLLSKLARDGDGRYYFAEHARDIPQLMTRETELATRGPVVEGVVTPRLVGSDPMLTSLAAAGLPQLGGYLVTSPRDLAQVLLVSDTGDPLLARWQYGLGHAVAWTSDLRGRWSDRWVNWPGTAQLFSDLVGWAIPQTPATLRLAARADADNAHITVDDPQPTGSPATVRAHVAQPDGAPLELELSPTGPGTYAASFPISGDGMYIVRAEELRDGVAIGAAEAGLPVAYPAELRQVTPDPRRLNQIARAGGGHLLASPESAFADDLAPMSAALPLQWLLLTVAAVLLPIEVGLRRVRTSLGDVLAWLRHPRPIPMGLPTWSAELPTQAPVWMPGAWSLRPRPSVPASRPAEADSTLSRHATPGLARLAADESPNMSDDEDALGATLKWLAARRGKG